VQHEGESQVSVTRIGTVLGIDDAGRMQTVSVYRDGSGYKLSGNGGSCLVQQPAIDAALSAAAEQYHLSRIEFVRSTRHA
jgi:hypothetical protein